MSFLICGDPHFSTSNKVESLILIEDFIDYIHEYKPTAVVILGDMLHKHGIIDMVPHNNIIKFLKKINDTGVLLFCLIGNHDRISNDVSMTDEHVFNSLKKWDRTFIVDRGFEYTFISPSNDGENNEIKALFMPYVPDNTFFKCIDECNLSLYDKNIVFSHQLFNGCDIAKLITSTGKFIEDYPEDAPLNIAGHIHEYQDLGNLIYVGTPFQTTFSESIDKKVMLLNISSDNTFTIKRLPLNILPKQTFTLDVTELYSFVIPEGIIKLKITGDSNLAKKIMSEKLKSIDDRKRIKIEYKDKKNNRVEKTIVNMKFRERLFSEISKTEYKNLFNEIFNKSNL